MFFFCSCWAQLLKRTFRPLTGGRRRPSRGRASRRLELEVLETRLVPAFNLTIGTAATHNVDQNAFGVFAPVGPGANIAVSDILADLRAGKSVVITDGALGTETGNITWLANSNLDYHGISSAGLSLTIIGFAPGASVTLNSNILDSNPTIAGGLNVNVSAGNDLVVAGSIGAGSGTVSLAADDAFVQLGGNGSDGVGTLTVGPGAAVTGTSVTLSGADVHLDTSSQPARVTATSVRIDNFANARFSDPFGVAFDAQGNLYVANVNGDSVSKVTPDGKTVSTFATGFNDPEGLAFDAQGNLYVANFQIGSVSKVTPDGKTVTPFATGFNDPASLAFDAQGNLYVANAGNNSVSQVTPSGTVSPFATGFNQPFGLAFDAQGNLYVANAGNNSVSQVTPSGTVSPFATGFNQPFGLAFDAQGNLYVANAGNNSVSQVTPDGKTVTPFATGFNEPVGLAFDAQGNLYVANFQIGSVSKVIQGSLTVRSSLPSRPISVGGPDNAVAGLNLTNAELTDLVAPDSLTIGDPSQTGTITFTTAAFSGTNVLAEQNPAGPGQIVLDDGGGAAPALADGTGSVHLTAGRGGIVAANDNNTTAEAAAANLILDTTGPIGSGAGRLQLQVSGAVVVGTASPPASVFLDGLGDLLLGNIQVAAGAPVDVTARGNLTVAGSVNAPGGSVSLAADSKPNGSGDDGVGTLTVAAGAAVMSTDALLRGADVNLDTSSNPASVKTTGGLTIRSSLPSRPISGGGPDNAVAGLNLTDAELADLAASSNLTFGDPTQTGTIIFTTATLAANFVQVRQSLAGPGAIVFDDNFQGPALSAPGAAITLTAGTGGIQEVNAGPGPLAIVASALQLGSGGPVGALAHPLTTQVARLDASTVNGSLFLADATSLTTTGTVAAAGVLGLSLASDFTTHAGDLHALVVNLVFTGSGTQHLDSGGQTFANLAQAGLGTLVLRSGGLILTGNLLNVAGELDANNQPLTVGGLTIVNGVLASAGSAPQTFSGGLVVNGTFSGASGTVTAGSVALSAGAVLNAPVILNDTGDWSNSGGLFNANGGTVVFTGSGPQRLLSGGQPFNNLTHSGSGLLTLADDLTLTGSLTNTSGAGNVDATNRTLQVGGDWSWGNTGSFLSAGSTVVLTGANQHLSGNTTFFNLSKVVTSTDTLTFQAGSTQTITGALTLRGAAGNPLALRSSVPGIFWNLNPKGSRSVSFVDVQDSSNKSLTPLTATTSHDSGHNGTWSFPASPETWTGTVSTDWANAANWDKGYVPNAADSVTVSGTSPFQPVLSTAVTVKNLTLSAGARLSLAGHNLTDTGLFTNQGTLVLQGNEAVKLAGGNDTKEGTWDYTGDNSGATLLLKDFGARDYFNLLFADSTSHPDTFRVGAGLVVKGNLTLTGGTFDAHGFGVAVAGLTTVNGGTYLAGSAAQSLGGGLAISAGLFSGATGVVNAHGVSLSGGTLLAPSSFMNDSGDFLVSGGTFNANKGTVALTGSNQHIDGSTTFFNLSKSVRAADTLTFQAGSTQIIGGTLTLHGAAGNLLKLRSSVPGSPWFLDPLGTAALSFLDVQDSVTTGATPLSATHSHDAGNNTNWKFV